MTKVRVLPSRRVVLHTDRRYYDPLGLPLPSPGFHHRLIPAVFARRRPGRRASPVPDQTMRACRSPYPGGTRQADPGAGPARRGLHRDMSGSAPPLFLCRGCRIRFMLRPARLLPPQRLLTPRSAHQVSPTGWGLLPGAPVPTRAGLPPAGLIQLPGRNMPAGYCLVSACFRPSTTCCCLPGSWAYWVGVGSRDALTRGGALLLGGGGSQVTEHRRVAVGGRSCPTASTPRRRSRRHRAAAVRPAVVGRRSHGVRCRAGEAHSGRRRPCRPGRGGYAPRSCRTRS